jgi:hypothetical protein
MHYHPETIVKTESNFRDNLYLILVNLMKYPSLHIDIGGAKWIPLTLIQCFNQRIVKMDVTEQLFKLNWIVASDAEFPNQFYIININRTVQSIDVLPPKMQKQIFYLIEEGFLLRSPQVIVVSPQFLVQMYFMRELC